MGDFKMHSAVGKANTIRGFQAQRPDWYEQEGELKLLDVPVLVVVGDEDDPCLKPALYLKQTIPACGLCIIPMCGHAPNAEEPAKFNAELAEFLAQVQAQKWVPLDGCSNDKFSQSLV